MEKQNKPRLNESSSAADLVKMQTEVALAESMAQSKTLTIMVIVGLCGFAGFFTFCIKWRGRSTDTEVISRA